MRKIPGIFFFKFPLKISLVQKRPGALLILTTIIIFTLFLITLFPIITNNLSELTSHVSEENSIKGNNSNNTQSIFQTYPDDLSSRSNRGILDTWGMSENEREYFMERTLLKRVGHPLDVARAILFLASDEASYITGETIQVDGGTRLLV